MQSVLADFQPTEDNILKGPQFPEDNFLVMCLETMFVWCDINNYTYRFYRVVIVVTNILTNLRRTNKAQSIEMH